MRPDNQEDSSSYKTLSQQPAEVQPQPIEEPNLLAAPKQKKSRAVLVLVLLLLLALGAVASFGWLWYQQNGRVDNLEADLSSARNNVALLESSAKAEAALDDAEPMTVDSDNGDEELIKSALAFAKSSVNPGKVTANVGKKIDNFAYITIATQGSGYYIIFKEVDDVWVPILHGNGEQTKEMMDTYGVPAELVKS